mmetsp:Transcript_63251/g.149902  ORF Transcript_63251/g.149902 Transcript_63251/m.149902 type:complete len:117 (+) Transcript_63251:333-683(+)
MLAVVAFVAHSTKKRKGDSWNVYGPLMLISLAVPLIMADLFRHLLQDQKIWPSPSSSQYRHGCETENIKCLSAIGAMFTIVFTYSGFILLAIATMWNANLIDKIKKIRKQWKRLRG